MEQSDPELNWNQPFHGLAYASGLRPRTYLIIQTEKGGLLQEEYWDCYCGSSCIWRSARSKAEAEDFCQKTEDDWRLMVGKNYQELTSRYQAEKKRMARQQNTPLLIVAGMAILLFIAIFPF